MKNIFLFPGQGAQKKGMFQDICSAFPEAMDVVKAAEEVSGEPVGRYLWETEDGELARSDRSQLAITTASLAAAAVLRSKGIAPDATAGFSLGEYAALCTAGVLSLEDTIILVRERGRIMQESCDRLASLNEGHLPGMAAVIGLPPEAVIEAVAPLAAEGTAFAANLNSPKQTVVSGTAEGLDKAEELCKAAGCRRFIRLKVAGPFHSPLMAEAGKSFEEILRTVDFKNPSIRVFSNVTGKEITSGEEARRLAVRHFTEPVCWTAEEQELARLMGITTEKEEFGWRLFETGPGTVLSGLWRDSGFGEDLSCIPANTIENLML